MKQNEFFFQAIDILRKSLELSIYHDCVADNEFEISTVDKDGVQLGTPEVNIRRSYFCSLLYFILFSFRKLFLLFQVIAGNWDIAEYNCDYQ